MVPITSLTGFSVLFSTDWVIFFGFRLKVKNVGYATNWVRVEIFNVKEEKARLPFIFSICSLFLWVSFVYDHISPIQMGGFLFILDSFLPFWADFMVFEAKLVILGLRIRK